MRIAVLADIHGNLPALDAVLADLGRRPVDAIVVAGDVTGGPFVAECLSLLRARPEPVHWIKGNGERETVLAFDGELTGDSAEQRVARHSAAALTAADRDEIDGWPITLALDGVRFCHGTPRSEDEVLTRETPEPVVREALAEVSEPLVVGGHTHQQTVRAFRDDADYVNAGSVGLAYEGDPAAFWLIVRNGVPEFCRTPYDIAGAAERIRASDFPTVEDYLDGALSPVLDADWVTAFFEYGAGRGHNPWPPVHVA